MSDIDVRVAVLEEKYTGLEKAQARMWKNLAAMDVHLKGIQKTLNKIQWIATGMVLLWLAQTFGIEEVLKKPFCEGGSMMNFPDLNEPATQSALAKLLDVNRSTVHGHHESGAFTKGASLGVWLREYFSKLQASAAGRVESTEDGKAIMNRLNLAKAIRTELDIAKDEKVLVLQSDVREEMEPAFLHIKTTLDALPSRVAAALSAQYGHPIDKRLIENECRTALSTIADYTPECEAAD